MVFLLKVFKVNDGIFNWDEIEKQIKEWQFNLLIVGLFIDLYGKDLDIIILCVKKFVQCLYGCFGLFVELYDECFFIIEVCVELFVMGGYKVLSKGNVDC